MKANAMEERYSGHFLDALDLPEGKLVPVTIEAIADPHSEKDSRGKPIKNAILSFTGKTKRLILNTTNFKVLKAQFGPDYKQWVGKSTHIQRRYLEAEKCFGLQNGLAIRIIPPIGTPLLKSTSAFMGSATPYGWHKPQENAVAPSPLAQFEAEIEAAKGSKSQLMTLVGRVDQFGEAAAALSTRIQGYWDVAAEGT